MSGIEENIQRSLEIEKILENVFSSLRENAYESACNMLDTLPDEILHIEQRASYYLAKAIILSKGETTKEIECLEEFLNLDSYNVDLLCSLGIRYLELGENQKAIECAKKAMLIAPDKKTVKKIAKKTGIIKRQEPVKSSLKSSRPKRQRAEFGRESGQLSIQAFRELKSKNIEQAIKSFKEALKLNSNNTHAMDGLFTVANKFSKQKKASQYQEIIQCLLGYIKCLERIEHITRIKDLCYKLDDEQLNSIINEKTECLISKDIENCLVIAKYFVNSRIPIAKQYLQRYKQKTNADLSLNALYCYDKIEKLIEEDLANCLKFAKCYIEKKNARIAQYCLEKYAEKIQRKDKIYFALMLEILRMIEDYEFTEEIYKEAKKANMNTTILSQYSVFLTSIDRTQKKNIRSNSIWDYLEALRPSDIVAARVTWRQGQSK